MKGLTSKKIKKPPKKANHKGNAKFPNPFLSREAYQIRKGEEELPSRPSLKKPSPTATPRLKILIDWRQFIRTHLLMLDHVVLMSLNFLVKK
jgi:hypothetical protein